MLSEAAKARAIRRGPGFLGLLVAHHGSGQLEHCYLVWFRSRPIWFCSRCAGLYPVMILSLLGQFYAVPNGGWWDIPWLLVLPLPVIVDWGLARVKLRPSTNRARTISGAILGLSLGRSVYLKMIRPFHPLVVIQLAGLAVVVLLVEILARCREKLD